MGEPARATQETVAPEEDYRTLWNHAGDARVIVDAQGTIRDVNRRAECKLGCRRLQLIGAPVLNIGDRHRLQRVGFNLLQNALQYSPRRGTITVSIKAGHEGAMPAGLGNMGDEVLLMRVEDEGPGIDADDSSRCSTCSF